MAQTKVQLLQPDLGDVIDFDSSTLFMDGADNRVGIRNTNPQYELDVTGTVNATNFRGNISVGTIDDWITHTGDTNTKFGFPAADTFAVETGGSERFRVGSNGALAIGTDVTAGNGSLFRVGSPLLAAGNGLAEGGMIVTPTSGTISTGQVLPIICAAGEKSNPGIARAGIAAVSTSGRSGMDLVFLTRFQADGTDLDVTTDEKIRIKDNGKVGIGTATPSEILTVHTASGNTKQVLSSHAGFSELDFTTASTLRADVFANASEFTFTTRTAIPMVFRTNGTNERVRITTGDVISFGNSSPPAWQTGGGYYNIQLGNSGYFRADTDASSNFLSYGVNAYRDSSGWKFKQDGRATQVTHQDGTFRFYTSNSGNAGNAITYAEALKIDSNGMSKFTRGSTGTVGHFYANARECNILLQNDAQTWKIVNYDYGNNGTDNLGFHDGTADRLVIAKTGKIGINNTNPDYTLDVRAPSGDVWVSARGGTNQGYQVRKSDNTLVGYAGNGAGVNLGANDFAISAPASNLLLCSGGTAASNERIHIKSDGKVGVNQGSSYAPLTSLDVRHHAGTAGAASGPSTVVTICASRNSSRGLEIKTGRPTSGNQNDAAVYYNAKDSESSSYHAQHVWQLGGGNAMVLGYTGHNRLGINENYPAYPLDLSYTDNNVYSTGANIGNAVEIHNKSTTASTSAGIHMYVTGNGANAAAVHMNCVHTGNGSGAFTVGTRYSAGQHIERLRVEANGDVAINTTDGDFGQSNGASQFAKGDPKLGVHGSIGIMNTSSTTTDFSQLAFYRRTAAEPQGNGSHRINGTHNLGKISWFGSSNDTSFPDEVVFITSIANGGDWWSGSNRRASLQFHNNNVGEMARWSSNGAHAGRAIMNRDCNGVSGGAWTTHGAWKVLIDLSGHPTDQLYMCDAAMQHLGAYTATFWVYKCNNGHYDIIHEESSLCDFRLNGSQIEIKQTSGVDQTNTTGYQKIFAVAGMHKPLT